MKKFIFATILLMSVTPLFAQIQITGADMPRAGRINVVSVDTLSHPDPGIASASPQSWDYSSLHSHYPQFASYSPVTPYQAYAGNFPGANMFTYGPSYLYAGFFGGAPVDANSWGYMFWKSDTTGFYITGFRVDYGIGPQNIIEAPQEMLMKTPAALDSSFTGSSRWVASFENHPFDADTHYISRVIKNLDCDAFGQMTTAFGTFDVLRVHETLVKVDSITGTIGSVNIYGAEVNRDSLNNYYFWANDLGYPVVIIKADVHDSVLSVEYLSDTLAGFTVTGTVFQNDSVTPVASGKAELIAKTALDQLYGIPETVPLTAGGHFQFSNIVEGGNFLVQAKPDTAAYPYEVPTYYGDAIYWMSAYTLSVASDTGIHIHTASDSLGYAMSGNGNVSGTIWHNLGGAKAMVTSGGIKVTLEQNPSGSVVRHTYSDSTGKYSFKNLPADNFRLHVDIPAISMDSTYFIYYASGDTNTFNLDFYYDSLYIYIYEPSGITNPDATIDGTPLVYPNPAGDQITLEIKADHAEGAQLSIYDLYGRLMTERTYEFNPGSNLVIFDLEAYSSGIYFIKVSNGGQSRLVKFVRQ